MSRPFDFSTDKIEDLLSIDPDEGKELVEKLIANYLTEAPKTIAAFKDASTKDDLDNISFRAHKMKSTSGNIGLVSVSKIAAELDEATDLPLGDPTRKKIKDLIEEFGHHFNLSQEVLKPYSKRNAA